MLSNSDKYTCLPEYAKSQLLQEASALKLYQERGQMFYADVETHVGTKKTVCEHGA